MSVQLQDARPASCFRQLAAMLYDAFLIAALWVLCGFIFVLCNRGEALLVGSAMWWLFRLSLLLVWALFYVYFWTAQAQTLGMRAWRLVLVNQNGRNLSTAQAWKRFLLMLCSLGLGFLWRLFDAEQRCWYDRVLGTRLYSVPKNPYV